jgi:hypothetical protein
MISPYFKTIIIFTDVPRHYELRVSDWPLLNEGDVVEIDANLRHPKHLNKKRIVQGEYVVTKKKYKHISVQSSLNGFIQYLELSPFKK